jgi:hypothetical protein
MSWKNKRGRVGGKRMGAKGQERDKEKWRKINGGKDWPPVNKFLKTPLPATQCMLC